MIKRYLSITGLFVKEGLLYFINLPFYMKVCGIFAAILLWLFLTWMRLRRKEKLRAVPEAFLTALIVYLSWVFIITTFSRNPGAARSISLKLFHPFRLALKGNLFAAKMIFFNLVLLAPLGLILPVVLEYRCGWKDVLFVTFLTSLAIEGTQYLFRLGLMEADDLICNCLGALMGYWLIRLTRCTVLLVEKAGRP